MPPWSAAVAHRKSANRLLPLPKASFPVGLLSISNAPQPRPSSPGVALPPPHGEPAPDHAAGPTAESRSLPGSPLACLLVASAPPSTGRNWLATVLALAIAPTLLILPAPQASSPTPPGNCPNPAPSVADQNGAHGAPRTCPATRSPHRRRESWL